ncbi:hypothetical protein M431DRAFT_510395 [Trichoderma harzianum CBS 226.95]|uniref:Uncharacterized protein n=1 Tax=Trichoderma harzianum CBS 226.95 TaxID=983964 RepID=A0A2T4A591_TRIHA|nr:hypothetical protein M431DRAFT_510395 [Trichoderma harzianum CBS 226.95]PTB52214.1 hypothetical protein M431DRAFT_510395 [Trichoderma harzianum CBS 226.95]
MEYGSSSCMQRQRIKDGFTGLGLFWVTNVLRILPYPFCMHLLRSFVSVPRYRELS